MKNMANQITNNITVSGIDLFIDSESFLNELNDSEMAQRTGANDFLSDISLLLCDATLPTTV